MKTEKIALEKKVNTVIIDNSLEQYNGKIMFPKKLELANKMLETARLPKRL